MTPLLHVQLAVHRMWPELEGNVAAAVADLQDAVVVGLRDTAVSDRWAAVSLAADQRTAAVGL